MEMSYEKLVLFNTFWGLDVQQGLMKGRNQVV